MWRQQWSSSARRRVAEMRILRFAAAAAIAVYCLQYGG